MKIISIDVGIKNLALCIFDIQDNCDDNTEQSNKKYKDNFKVTNWEVVNLCKEKIEQCSCFLSGKKKNTKCNKKACYYKNNQYFCKTHAKQSEYIIPTSELNSTRLNKYKINELYQICEKFDIHYEKPISKKKLLEKVIMKILT